jgi:DNA-binding NarL/FixJ family response regulator
MQTPSVITIALLEDDPACALRFQHAIAQNAGMRLIAQFDRAASAVMWLSDHQPDVLLCDLGLPDHSGLDVIRFCSTRNPETKILVITLYEDEQHVFKSIESGASGYLLKDSLSEEITAHITELINGGSPITPIIARYLLKRLQPSAQPTLQAVAQAVDKGDAVRLSEREMQILTRISQGFSYGEIAAQLGLSRHTVHTHIKKIYEKLSVHSRSEAVFEARQMGLLLAHQ